ncbi:MAG: FAD-binding oxidoreductase [Alphaproteobacteria bacterium]|nr:FAD-binding oxidoreductase [Alphaproteobacteria bacterium]
MANAADHNVIIIGGGLGGAAATWFLSREGLDVLLLERGELNAKASGANAGSLHLQIPAAEYRKLGRAWAEHFAPTLTMLQAGAELWATLEDALSTPLEFNRSGGIIAARTGEEMELVRDKAALEARYGIEMEILDAADLLERAPYLAGDMAGGAFYPGEGKASPLLATRAFANAAVREGARLMTQTEVTGMTAGPPYVVATKRGTFTAEKIVCAAGAEAGRIAEMAGLDLPIHGFPIQVSVTEPTGPLVPHLVYSAAGKLTLKQMANGTCLIGGGWSAARKADESLSVSNTSLASNMAMAQSVVPALSGLRVVRSWPAMVNGTDSWRPIVGEAPSCPGFFLCLFPWMGFTAGPIAAHCVADLILGRTPPIDLTGLSELPA